jgi:hypothetical protein
MKLTQGVISREEALKLAPDYVAFVEDDDKWDELSKQFEGVKKGRKALTFDNGVFVRVVISSVKNPNWEADTPVVRVSNGEYTWRVDGDKFAWLL